MIKLDRIANYKRKLLYWRNCSRRLGRAITAYILREELNRKELKFVKDYFLHWVRYPGHRLPYGRREKLESQIQAVQSVEELKAVEERMGSDGIEPL